MAATVLVVEDERKLRDFIRSYLERAGFTVLSTGSGAEAISMVTAAEPTGGHGADRRTGPPGRRRRRSTAPPRSGRFLSSTLPYAALLAVSLCGTSAPPERACLVKLSW